MNKKVSLASKIILLLLFFSFVAYHAMPAAAESLSDLKKKKDYYAAQAEQARKEAEAKKAQADALKNQLTLVANQIDQTEDALSNTSTQIDQTSNNVNQLSDQIKTQEDSLAVESDKMKKVVSSWYMEQEGGLFQTLLKSDKLSDAINDQQYYTSVRQQINLTQDRITAVKNELNNKKQEQQNQLAALQGLKNDQESQRKSLEQSKSYKNRLLNNTTEAISDLKVQEQEAQKRIVEIDAKIRALSVTRNWGDQIISSNDSSWYYQQIGNYTHLGNSPYTVSQYGCLITSMAMVATYYGYHVTPSDIASNTGIFDREGYLQVNTPPGIGITVNPSQAVNWAVVDDELANGHPVIVSLYMPSVGAVNRDGSSHFIVIKGHSGSKYLMHDPIGDGRGYNMSQVRSMKIVRPN